MTRGQDSEDTRPGSADIPPPIPAFSWLGVFSPLLIGPILVLVLIALFAPDNVLDQWPTAKAFTNWMQAKLPFINRHADSTRYPQLALLVNCMCVALIPILSVVWVAQSWENYPKLLKRGASGMGVDIRTHLFILIFNVPLFLGITYLLVLLPGDPSWAQGLTTNRRGGLAVMCSLSAYLTSMAIGGWPLSLRLFIDLHLRGKSK